MVQMNLEYLGNLKVKAQHGPSETIIHTAAPVDNNGDGSSFLLPIFCAHPWLPVFLPF